jgi:hypothetical protein
MREASSSWSAGVSVVWFGVGLAALLGLTQHVHFEWTPTPGLHSWVTEHRYPIQQQLFWFYAVILGVPFSVFAGHFVWAAMTSLLAWTGLSERMALRASALTFVPLLVAWPSLWRLAPAESQHALLVGGAGSVLLLALVMVASRFLARRSPMEALEQEPASESLLPAREPRALARSLRLLFVLVVLPADLYLACFDPRIGGAVDLFHEGEQLIPLLEVLRGGVPYRDVYLQHGFLENLGIPWLGATLFDPTLVGVRWIEAFVDPLGKLGAYALIVSLTGARLLPALLFGVLVIASPAGVSSRAFFGLCSIAVLAWTLRGGVGKAGTRENSESSGTVRFVCSGALAMIALLHSTEVGVYTLATGVLFLALTSRADHSSNWPSGTRPLIGFALGALLVWMPFALTLAAHGALDDFLGNLLHQTRYQLETWGKPFPGFFATFLPLVSGDGAGIPQGWADRRFWWYLCPALLTASGAWLAHCTMRGRFRSSPLAPPLLLLSIAAAFYFRSVLGRADPSHLQYGVLFPLLMMVFFADALWCEGRWLLAGRSTARRRATGACLLLAAAAAAILPLCWVDRAAKPGLGVAHACAELTHPVRKRLEFDASLTTQDIVPASQRKRLDELASFLAAETTPEERVFDFTNRAGQLFFADRRSATRYFQIVYASLPDMQQEVIDRLEAERTRFVLMRAEGWKARFDGVPYRTRHALIAQYVASRYSPFRTIAGLQIWKRNDVGA